MGRATLSKSLILFSIDGRGCVSSLLFGLRPNNVRGNGGNGASFRRAYARTVVFSAPNPKAGHCRPLPLPETPGHSQASLAQSLVGSLLLSPGSWCTQGSVCVLQDSVSPVLCKFWCFCGGVNGDCLLEGLCHRSTSSRAPVPAAGDC